MSGVLVRVAGPADFGAVARLAQARERDWSPAPGVDLLALRLDLTGQPVALSPLIRSSSS